MATSRGPVAFDAYALDVRDCVERCLADPVEKWYPATDTYEWVAPIADEFHVELVELRGTRESPEIAVLFRWDGEEDLFGIVYPVREQGTDGSPDAYVSIYVQEDLLALGYGVENAHRQPREGVTWLDWRGSSCLKQ